MPKQKSAGTPEEPIVMPDAATAGVVQYLGDGYAYVEGVPARDLSLDEWQRVRPDLRELAVNLNLYRVPQTDAAEAKE